jgi:hypothetical protein
MPARFKFLTFGITPLLVWRGFVNFKFMLLARGLKFWLEIALKSIIKMFAVLVASIFVIPIIEGWK